MIVRANAGILDETLRNAAVVLDVAAGVLKQEAVPASKRAELAARIEQARKRLAELTTVRGVEEVPAETMCQTFLPAQDLERECRQIIWEIRCQALQATLRETIQRE